RAAGDAGILRSGVAAVRENGVRGRSAHATDAGVAGAARGGQPAGGGTARARDDPSRSSQALPSFVRAVALSVQNRPNSFLRVDDGRSMVSTSLTSARSNASSTASSPLLSLRLSSSR